MVGAVWGAYMERPDDRIASVLRFAAELVAWVATPWVLSTYSWLLAVLAVVVLIGLPTVFSTPGDKAQVIIPVPGTVTILLVLLQLAAAVIAAWSAWPVQAAVLVSLLVATTLVTERRRWRSSSVRRYVCAAGRSTDTGVIDIELLRLLRRGPWTSGLRTALIGHEQFRDDYAGGGVLSDGSRHGPYWLRLFTPDLYEPISQEKAVQILREWADPFWDPSAGLKPVLRREVFNRLAAADGIYYLSELGDEAIHDWGRVHDCFHEFVLIDRSAGQIFLIVAADD